MGRLYVPSHLTKHFRFMRPLSTHFRPATCEEVRCRAYVKGWQTQILEGDSGLGDAQAHYIRKQSGRAFTEERMPDGTTLFTFEPGQRCFNFDGHRIGLDRPERFYIGSGEQYREVSPTGWRDDFGEHQERLAEQMRRAGREGT